MHVRVLASPNPPANRSARFLKFASTSRSKSFDPLDFWWRNNRRATEKSEGELLLPFIDTVARSQTVRKVPPLESNGTTMKNLVLILTRRPVNNHRSRCYKPQLVSRCSHAQLTASTRRKSARDYRIWNIITDINIQRVLSFPIRQALPPYFSIKRSILSCKRKFPNWIHLQLHSNIPIFEKERKYKTSLFQIESSPFLEQPLPLFQPLFLLYLPTSFSLFLFWTVGRFRAGSPRPSIKTRPTAFLSTLLFLRGPVETDSEARKGAPALYLPNLRPPNG